MKAQGQKDIFRKNIFRMSGYLADNLADLIKKRGLTIKQLCQAAEKKGYKLTESQISNILNPNSPSNDNDNNIRIPRYSALYGIAEVLEVSVDYLIGRTKIETIDRDKRIVEAMTGLSDKSIEILENWTESISSSNNGVHSGKLDKIPPNELNTIIENPNFTKMIYFMRSLSNLDEHSEKSNDSEVLNPILSGPRVEALKSQLGPNLTREFIIDQAVKAYRDLINESFPPSQDTSDSIQIHSMREFF